MNPPKTNILYTIKVIFSLSFFRHLPYISVVVPLPLSILLLLLLCFFFSCCFNCPLIFYPTSKKSRCWIYSWFIKEEKKINTRSYVRFILGQENDIFISYMRIYLSSFDLFDSITKFVWCICQRYLSSDIRHNFPKIMKSMSHWKRWFEIWNQLVR